MPLNTPSRIWPNVLMSAALLLALAPTDSRAQGFFNFFSHQDPTPPPAAVTPPPAAKPPVHKKPPPKPVVTRTEPAKPDTGPVEEPPPPYEPQLLRLAEILGALSYLRDICGSPDADKWRGRMQALLDAETKTELRKDHLAGAYNRGFHGYELSYTQCTASARLVIQRFMTEGEKITHEVGNRYSAS